jgi:hypothetical protein
MTSPSETKNLYKLNLYYNRIESMCIQYTGDNMGKKMKKSKYMALTPLIFILFLSSLVLLNSESMNNWKYQCVISIDNTNNTQKLTNYQVFINLDSSTFNFSHTQRNGDDLRFLNQNSNMLSYWVEFYDPQNETARIWVKMGNIPASDTASIIMLYGNSKAANASDFDATFTKDSVVNGLVALWHMDEGSGTVITDSSGNGHDGVVYTNGSSAWAGFDGGRWDKIQHTFSTGDSLDFDGINDYVSVDSVASGIVSSDTVVAFWIKGGGSIFTVCTPSIYRDYFRMGQDIDGRIHAAFRPGNNYKWCIKTENVYPLDEWVFIVLGHDKNQPYLYVNGVLAKIDFKGCFPGTLDRTYYFDDYGTPARVEFGAFRTKGNPYGYYSGEIDEVRIYERTLLPGEITALYERREYTDPEPIVSIGSTQCCDMRWILIIGIAGVVFILLWMIYRYKRKSNSEFRKVHELKNELERIEKYP